jgi:hypothetical protein
MTPPINPWVPTIASILIGGMGSLGVINYLTTKEKYKVKQRTMHEWSFKIAPEDEVVVCAMLEGAKTTFIVTQRGKFTEKGIVLDFEQLELLGKTIAKVLEKFTPLSPPPPPPKPTHDDRLGEFSPGLFNILENRGILTLETLATYSAVDLLKISRLGRERLREVRKLLKTHGLRLAGE